MSISTDQDEDAVCDYVGASTLTRESWTDTGGFTCSRHGAIVLHACCRSTTPTLERINDVTVAADHGIEENMTYEATAPVTSV
uniref:Uncharacterized protein n=1 Tax=Oryza sativa subsp. japonica TaxID=39947 RepID=Q6Z585_ORYSJ|nr:hypothetical protein [Oryza sativa Japonica Group]